MNLPRSGCSLPERGARYPLRGGSAQHQLCAIDFYVLADNIAGCIGGQEGDHLGAFQRSSHTSQWNHLDEIVHHFRGGKYLMEWSVNHTRRDTVHTDPEGRQLFCHGLCNGHESSLGCRVRTCAGATSISACDRADIHDAPAFAFHHRSGDCLRTQNCALEIQVHHGVPAFLGEIEEGQTLQEGARIIYQDIDRSERTDHLLNEGANLLRAGYVGLNHHGLSTLRMDLALYEFRSAFIRVVSDSDS